jgi:hypothetical protein
MADERKTEVGKSPGYIPHPPSREDVEKVSGQQGMISDEWAPNPPPTEGTEAEKDTEGQPG